MPNNGGIRLPKTIWDIGQERSYNIGIDHKINKMVKNGVFWDVTPYGSCNSRRFGRTSQLVSIASYS
jgi:hypothetical protein